MPLAAVAVILPPAMTCPFPDTLTVTLVPSWVPVTAKYGPMMSVLPPRMLVSVQPGTPATR